VRHLTESQAFAALRRGAAIEQLLSTPDRPERLEWLCLSPRSSEMYLIRHRVHNVIAPDYRDVYEFPPVDVEEDHGEGVVLGRFADAVAAFEAAGGHGARPDRWVNEGVVQDEAADTSGL
jgi:hypothetical protein